MGSIAGWEGTYKLILVLCQVIPNCLLCCRTLPLKPMVQTNTGVVAPWELKQFSIWVTLFHATLRRFM